MTEANSGHPPTDRAAAHEQLLAAYLAERDVPCASCGYNLRGTASGVCPECGTKIEIALGQVDRSTVPWFLAIVGYAIATGVSAMFAFVFTMILAFDGGDSDDKAMFGVLLCTLAVSLNALVWIIHKRHRIWAWRPRRQWMLAASVLLLPVLVFIGMALALTIAG